jgi:tetratricopeptide (TPR) repeat protein
MQKPSATFRTTRTLMLLLTGVLLPLGFAGCRRGANKNIKPTSSDQSPAATDPEQAKRQAQNLVDQGKELYKNDQDEKAADVLKKAIDQDPNNAEAFLRLGMAYAALERKPEADDAYKKAVELYKKKIQADQKDADAFFNLAEAHAFLHQDEEAARNYRLATHLKPDDEEAFYQLGMAETRLAHYPEAMTAFKKALEIDPEDYRATDAIENAQEGANRIREGKKHAQDMLKKQQANENGNSNSNSGSNSNSRLAPKHAPTKPPVKKKN